MNEPCSAAVATVQKVIPNLRRRKARLAETIHVLAVGPVNRSSTIHDALLQVPNSRVSIATDYRGLWVISQQEAIRIAVLHDALPSFELEAACRLIRRRWPRARILVLRSRADSLDDALYDDRVASTVAPQVLLATIRRLVGRRRENETGKVAIDVC